MRGRLGELTFLNVAWTQAASLCESHCYGEKSFLLWSEIMREYLGDNYFQKIGNNL